MGEYDLIEDFEEARSNQIQHEYIKLIKEFRHWSEKDLSIRIFSDFSKIIKAISLS
jgi:hypothetical protein